MKSIYQVTIHGRTLESEDWKLLLARAVSEKRNMDQRVRRFWHFQRSTAVGYETVSAGRVAFAGQTH